MRTMRLALAGLALVASAAVTTPAQAATPFPATGLFRGLPVVAVEVNNVTIESLPGATIVGQVSLFVSTNPAYSCLAGSNMNVWTASPYNGQLYIHNGFQGPQCTYGTWVIHVPF